MKWSNEKGASLGFSITAALLAAILICALFVSCGRTHEQSGVRSLESGVQKTNGNTAQGSGFDSGLKTQDSGLALDAVLREIDAYPVPKNVDAARFASLKAELKRLLTERANGGTAGRDAGSTKDISVEQASAPAASGAGGPARQSSAAKSIFIAPAGTMNAVTDLAATVNPAGTQATLTWTEVLPGDYDNNGVVDIADLLPVALYYGQRTDSGPDDAHRLVNGDADPEINIWDLGAIAGNYAAHLEGYQVWRGHWNGSSTDWETAFLPNTGNPFHSAFSIDRPSPPPISSRPAYTYTDDISGVADKNNIRYKVTAFGDGAPGAESNEAAVPATTFSVSGKVTLLGNGLAGVTLTLAPGNLHATTQADGTYAISGVANGSNTLTPTATGYVFAPASLPVTVNGANVSGLDFTATGGLANSAWPKFHGNAQNTGQSPYIGAQTNHLKWTCTTGSYVYGSPSIGADGTVYIGSGDGNVYALNPADGSVKWKYTAGGYAESSPAIGADGTIYLGAIALSPSDGSLKWSHPTGNIGSPAVGADGTVYVGSMDKNVYALNPADGTVKWTYKTGDQVNSAPVIAPDGTIYVGSSDNNVYALSPSDGSVKWAHATGGPVPSSPAIGADGTVCVGSYDNNVYALNSADGSVRWTCTTGLYVYGSPAIGVDGTVYIGSGDGKVYALNPADGSVKWSYAAGARVLSSPAVGADGTVYVGSDDYKIYALNPADGSVKWSYTTGNEVFSSPAIGADGAVYVGSFDYKVYAFGGVGPSTYNVSGTVTLSGAGLAGVTMTLTPGGKTATTASDGTYKFSDTLEDTYTLTPTATGYAFTPAQRSVTVKALDVTGQDFTATGGLANSAWPKFAGSVGNTGQSQYVGAQTNHVKWRFYHGSLGGATSSVAVGIDGTLYFGDYNGYVNALNSADGSVRWRYRTGLEVPSTPAIGIDGTVYVGSCDSYVYAFDPATGAIKWQQSLSYAVASSPAIGVDGTIYIGGSDMRLHAINPVDGSIEWTFGAGDTVTGCPAIASDGTVYTGSMDTRIYSIYPSGAVRWVYKTNDWVSTSQALGVDGVVYATSSWKDGNIYALSPADGSVKWRQTIGDWYNPERSSPAVSADGTVYVASGNGNVYAIRPEDGSVKWTYKTGDRAFASPAIGAEGTVYVGSTDMNFYALNGTDGSVKWRYATGHVIETSAAIAADGTVYVNSYDGYLYAFGP